MTVLADPPAGRPDVAVVRQPIADERHTVVGYELLFGGERVSPDSATDAKATSALLVDAFGDIGLEVLAGRHPAWMSIARNFLIEIGPPPVRPDRAVLQIAAYAARDDLLAVLQQLGRSGYTLALDDFDGRTDIEPLLGLCSIVKVRVGDRDDATLADIIAEPRIFRHRGVGTGGISSLRALGELSAADASFDDLERIISSDVGLSLKLLRYVNSAFFSLPRNVSSVHEALSLLGVRTVRRWTTVMVLASIPDVPDELVSLGLRRAHMCEILVGNTSNEEREMMFT